MTLDAYCDRCGSEKVTISCTDKIEKSKKISMSELTSQDRDITILAIMMYHNYRADCQDCGHYVEWSE